MAGVSGQFMRLPAVQAARSIAGLSILTTQALLNHVDVLGSEEPSEGTIIDIGALRTSRKPNQ